jgi:hypothetical protein
MSDLLTRAGVATTPSGSTCTRSMITGSTSRCPTSWHLGAAGYQADGAPIPLGKGGPIRLVFPPDAPAGKNKDLWIWSIDSMTIR